MTNKDFRRQIMEYLDTIEMSVKRDVIHNRTERVKDMVADSIYELCEQIIQEKLNGKNAYTNIK